MLLGGRCSRVVDQTRLFAPGYVITKTQSVHIKECRGLSLFINYGNTHGLYGALNVLEFCFLYSRPGKDLDLVKGPGKDLDLVKGPGKDLDLVKGPGKDLDLVKGPGKDLKMTI